MSGNESMHHGQTRHVGAATRTVKRARLEADKRRDVLAAQRGIAGHRRVQGSPWGVQRFRSQGEDLQGALVVVLPRYRLCYGRTIPHCPQPVNLASWSHRLV